MTSRRAFESHWQAWGAAPLPASKLAEAHEFLKPVFAERQGGRVLDVGCGDGVHAAVFADQSARPRESHWRYTGVDLSPSAAVRARSRFGAGADAGDVVAGDALRLPFAAESFDAVFAYGVLAYTGDPQAALNEMTRVTRPGGRIGIWLYPRRRGLAGAAFTGLRRMCRILGPRGSKPIVWSIVLLLPWLPVRSGVHLGASTWRQCVEIVEVNLLPPVLEFFDPADVETWCRERNLEVLVNDPARPVTVWARRSA